MCSQVDSESSKSHNVPLRPINLSVIPGLLRLSLRFSPSFFRQKHRDGDVRPWEPAGRQAGRQAAPLAMRGKASKEFAELLIRFVCLGYCRENLAWPPACKPVSQPPGE